LVLSLLVSLTLFIQTVLYFLTTNQCSCMLVGDV
jgi:hypothetical protein